MAHARTTTRPFDVAAYLDDDETIAAYLAEALETGDVAYIAQALGTVARAKGMAEVAANAGLSRESLYKALSVNGNPELATVLRVMQSLGMRLTVEPAGTGGERRPSSGE